MTLEATDSETTTEEVETVDAGPQVSEVRQAIEESAKELAAQTDTPEDGGGKKKPQSDAPPKEAPVADTLAPQPDLSKEPKAPEVVEQPSQETRPPIPPPQFLDAQKKAQFDKLPYEAKELVASIEHQTRRWGSQIAQEVAETRKLQKELERVITPHQNFLKLNKVEPVQAIDHLLTNAAMLEQNPMLMISRFMQQYGLTPEHFINRHNVDGSSHPYSGNGQYQPEQEYYDPRADDALKRVETLEEQWKAEAQTREQQKQQALMGEIEAFKNGTDEKGQPLRPHFDRFRTQIGRKVDELEAEKPWLTPPQLLNEAYNFIVSDIEETFVKPRLTNGQFAPKDHKQVEQSKRAQAAASSLSGSTLGNSAKRTYKGTQDAMREAARELGMDIP